MQKHDLHHEFPEWETEIFELKVNNNHFKKLFDEYHSINKDIHGVEASGVFTDEDLTHKRSTRLHLKDELLKIIQEHARGSRN